MFLVGKIAAGRFAAPPQARLGAMARGPRTKAKEAKAEAAAAPPPEEAAPKVRKGKRAREEAEAENTQLMSFRIHKS